LRQGHIAGFDDFFVHNSQFVTLFIAIFVGKVAMGNFRGLSKNGDGQILQKNPDSFPFN
jgi:hypothetical protein